MAIGKQRIFKVKRNGIDHAQLVEKGYAQVPGLDYTDNFSPVVNDVTL